MPRFIIEHEVPGAGELSQEEIKSVFQHGLGIVEEMGPGIEWVQSYFTADKVYCEYIAPNEEVIREHARRAGFPANKVSEVATLVTHSTLVS